MNNNFVELSELETSNISAGGWLGVVGGVLFVGAGIASGGAIPIGLGIVSGGVTIITSWPH